MEIVPIYMDGCIEHYEIYENGQLVATCDNNELQETVIQIESCQ